MTTTGAIDLHLLAESFLEDGYVLVPNPFTEEELAGLEAALVGLQAGVLEGSIDRDRYGGDYLTSAEAGGTLPFVNYVKDVTRLSPEAHAAFTHPAIFELVRRCLPDTPWMFEESHGERFGVVYQDSRPGTESGYSRIGWHSDHQAYPNSDFWPGIAVTIHLDCTSPANGFLRVVPGSHRWSTQGMPLGFEKIPGEIPVYAEAGDVILHHCDTWHAAARATEDPPGGIRRHLRGSWYAGRKPAPDEELEPFNKNARR